MGMPAEAFNPGQDSGIPGLHAEQDLPAEPWGKGICITRAGNDTKGGGGGDGV